MPLSMVRVGESSSIKKITGKDETRRFLSNLGFTPGEIVSIISDNAGNIICKVKDSRVAIDKTMANRIIV